MIPNHIQIPDESQYDVIENTAVVDNNFGGYRLNTEAAKTDIKLNFILNKDLTNETFFENRLDFADEDQLWIEDIFEDDIIDGDFWFETKKDFINNYVRERDLIQT